MTVNQLVTIVALTMLVLGAIWEARTGWITAIDGVATTLPPAAWRRRVWAQIAIGTGAAVVATFAVAVAGYGLVLLVVFKLWRPLTDHKREIAALFGRGQRTDPPLPPAIGRVLARGLAAVIVVCGAITTVDAIAPL